MKSSIHSAPVRDRYPRRRGLPVITAVLQVLNPLLLARAKAAVTYQGLKSFVGSDGANPYYAAPVKASDGAFYGTTARGSAFNWSTVLQLRPGNSGTTQGPPPPPKPIRVGAGGDHSLFVKSHGSLWATGRNDSGQLGDGATADRSTPERIVGSGPIPTLLITSVARVGYTLQRSFVSDGCHSYNVLTTTDPVSGTWSTILIGIPGNGGIVQVTIPNAFVQPRQFFRIQQAQ